MAHLFGMCRPLWRRRVVCGCFFPGPVRFICIGLGVFKGTLQGRYALKGTAKNGGLPPGTLCFATRNGSNQFGDIPYCQIPPSSQSGKTQREILQYPPNTSVSQAHLPKANRPFVLFVFLFWSNVLVMAPKGDHLYICVPIEQN